MAIPSKPRVRGSKYKKKAWKKTDITEIEEYLEEKRFDERIGGTVSEKSDADLYTVQTTTEDVPGSKKIKAGSLKCHSSIGVFSKVPVPISINKEPYSKKITRAKQNAAKRRKKIEQLKTKKLVKDELKKADDKLLRGDFYVTEVKDIWAKEEEIDPEIRDLVLFRDEYTKKRGPKVPAHLYQKPSLLPAVEVPHPGASYNPAYDDHQELLSKALEIEEVKQRDELHLKRVLTDMFPTKANAPTQESILEEMAQGLFEDDTAENAADVFLSQHRNPRIIPDDRVPKAKKRRKKERKEQERLLKVEKLRKKQLNEVYRLRSIKSEIKQEEAVSLEKQEKRVQEKIERMYKPLTLSKHKFEAPDLEVALSDELCDSLRTLKSEGNLLEDRYKSLQKRNIIEPRVKQKRKRKYKLKRQVKRNHRGFQ